MAAYAPDTFYTPIVIDATNNGLVVTEDPAGTPNIITITLDAGTYFMHDDASWHATRPGLLYAIQKLLNDGTTAGVGTVTGTPTFVFSWEVSAPTGSTGLTNNGLTLRATAPASSFEITWTNAASTMDARWFGHTLASPVADQASSTDSADQIVRWSRASKHRMVTRDLLGEGSAIDKRRHHYKDAQRSSDRPSDSVSVVWDEGFYRVLVYQDVYGTEVHEDRASESEWASGAALRATGDNHAVWWQVWDALTDDLEIVVVHNSSNSLQVDSLSYEVCKLWQDPGWGGMFAQTTPGGDLYDVELTLWVDPANSNYNH